MERTCKEYGWKATLALTLVLWACTFNSPQATYGPQIYARNCAVCHGNKGEGNVGPPLNHEGHAHHHTDAELYSMISQGIPPGARQPTYPVAMPPWQDKLSPKEIRQIIDHIKSLWTEEQRRFQSMLSIRE